MKLHEKSFSIWIIVSLYQDSSFRNPAFTGHAKMQRIHKIAKTESHNLRLWREYFFKFSESVLPSEANYYPEPENQLDVAMDEEADQFTLL